MNIHVSPKPFLRWAGGKQWLIKELESFLPEEINNYHEPFLGGGSVFIYLKSQGKIKGHSYLSDLNKDLINSYVTVRDDLEELIKKLKTFKNEPGFYYEIRNKVFTNKISRAAQFIYLNRTSFNGIYRVNLQGQYNVPFGRKQYAQLFDYDNLRKVSDLFHRCHFKYGDFSKALTRIKSGDLVFLDPPYTIAHQFNGFIKYNQKIFQWEDQKRLRDFILAIKDKGAHFILTNAAHQSISNLYKDLGKRILLSRYSVVGGKLANREKFNEYVFTD